MGNGAECQRDEAAAAATRLRVSSEERRSDKIAGSAASVEGRHASQKKTVVRLRSVFVCKI